MIKRKLCLEKFRERIHCLSELLKFKRTERAKCSHIDSDKGKCLTFSRHLSGWLDIVCNYNINQCRAACVLSMLSLHMHLNAIKKVSENESATCKKENDKYQSSKQYILSGNVLVIL